MKMRNFFMTAGKKSAFHACIKGAADLVFLYFLTFCKLLIIIIYQSVTLEKSSYSGVPQGRFFSYI